MEYKFISWNKNSQVILKKKNLSLVTVTNDKFNLKKMLTIFFDLEVRTDFISMARVGVSMLCLCRPSSPCTCTPCHGILFCRIILYNKYIIYKYIIPYNKYFY